MPKSTKNTKPLFRDSSVHPSNTKELVFKLHSVGSLHSFVPVANSKLKRTLTTNAETVKEI